MAKKEVIFTPQVPLPSYATYSQAIKYGNLIFVAGLTARGKDGELVGKDDLTTQAHQVHRNVEEVLRAAGASFKDVVYLIMLFKTRQAAIQFRESGIRKQYFGDHRPVTIGAVCEPIPDDALVEMSAVAALDE